MRLGVVIPAYNEEESVGQVVGRCLAQGTLKPIRVVVGNNNSSDRTSQVAKSAGAEVVRIQERGYGAACLGAIQALGDWPDVLVFLDADGSSRPEEIHLLLEPIQSGNAEFVIGRRPSMAPMTPPQRFGTWLAVQLIRLRWNALFQDIGPFRAIRRSRLVQLEMRDKTWGWTVEMQIKGILEGLKIEEVPVSWMPRLAGVSKISGTLPGVVRAGSKILWTIAYYGFRRSPVNR